MKRNQFVPNPESQDSKIKIAGCSTENAVGIGVFGYVILIWPVTKPCRQSLMSLVDLTNAI